MQNKKASHINAQNPCYLISKNTRKNIRIASFGCYFIFLIYWRVLYPSACYFNFPAYSTILESDRSSGKYILQLKELQSNVFRAVREMSV